MQNGASEFNQAAPGSSRGPGALLTAQGVAELLDVDVRTVWRMRDAGHIPQPLRIGRKVIRWRLAEVEKWIADGCPACKPARAARA